MLGHFERINCYQADVPSEFQRDVVRALEQLYPSTYDETSDLPGEYQRYLRPHLLRTRGEIVFITSAGRHKLTSETRKNRSKDAHALVVTKHCVLTLSRTGGPADPPRFARFRSGYATATTYRLPFVEFADEAPPLMMQERHPRLYVVICHGPRRGKWRELGFVYANFVANGGLAYAGQGIDLLARYGTRTSEPPIEQVDEPGFGLQDGEDAQEESA